MDNPEEVESWCEENKKKLGTLDVVIHNAGLGMRCMLMDSEATLGKRLLDVDFLSVFAMTKALMGNMRRDEQGSVVCGIGSMSGIGGSGSRTMYAAVKGALEAFFKCLNCEVKGDNIHSMVIHPGYVQTDVSVNALVGDGKSSFGKRDPNIKNGLPVDQ